LSGVRHVSGTELLHQSKLEPVRRLEVFTGAGRRRAWTSEQKGRILAESCESGEKVSAVARRHGLTPQQLFGWRREARQRAERRARDDWGDVSGGAFAPVIVGGSPPSLGAPITPSPIGGAAMIEIVIGAATVRVSVGIDAATLTTVLRAMKAAT
jgi:transposase